nr:11213_t:CDS:2 [Entrophospora candida]
MHLPSDSNKIRRNEIKEKRVRLAQNQVLVVEKAKDPMHKDIKKASGDQNKLSMLMHDQHSRFYSILYENYLEEEMSKSNVFGLQISTTGLYVKSKLFSDMSSLREYKSYDDFLIALEKDDGFRTTRRLDNPWIVKFNKSPPTISKEEKENSKKAK